VEGIQWQLALASPCVRCTFRLMQQKMRKWPCTGRLVVGDACTEVPDRLDRLCRLLLLHARLHQHHFHTSYNDKRIRETVGCQSSGGKSTTCRFQSKIEGKMANGQTLRAGARWEVSVSTPESDRFLFLGTVLFFLKFGSPRCTLQCTL
jgi:hypothetical protein